MTSPNDRLASAMVRAQVGALREGTRLFNERKGVFDRASRDIDAAHRRATGHSPRTAGAIARESAEEFGRWLEEGVDEFAERRLDRLVSLMEEASGRKFKRPSGVGSVAMMRGSVSKRMGQAARAGAERASAVSLIARDDDDAPAPGEASTRRLRAHAKTISRTGHMAAQNAAVLAIARANPRIVHGVMAVVTLDEGTTELCEGRAGAAWNIETGLPLEWSTSREEFPGRPPWHYGCRTGLSPVLIGEDPPTEELLEIEQWAQSEDAALAFPELELAEAEDAGHAVREALRRDPMFA